MNWKRWRNNLTERIRRGRKQLDIRRLRPAVKSIMDSFSDDWMEKAFRKARERPAPEIDHLPVDFELRQSGWPRRLYERVFPVSHVARLHYRYEDRFLDDYMPINAESYIGRGSYKFVYRLPWRMVVKVGKEILPSDPLVGSTFREVATHPENFLSDEERDLLEHLQFRRSRRERERLEFKFHRLGMERYHYWRVREALPDLVLPTRFFMGLRFRQMPLRNLYSAKITPMDSQIMLVGKHLKEFARGGKMSTQGKIQQRFFPKYDFEFDIGRFGKIKKKVLENIARDFRRLIDFTEMLAREEKLILDIHTENIIITLPDFELKIFDFHLFDEHLYEPSLVYDTPEKDHVEVIERFIESFNLDTEVPS